MDVNQSSAWQYCDILQCQCHSSHLLHQPFKKSILSWCPLLLQLLCQSTDASLFLSATPAALLDHPSVDLIKLFVSTHCDLDVSTRLIFLLALFKINTFWKNTGSAVSTATRTSWVWIPTAVSGCVSQLCDRLATCRLSPCASRDRLQHPPPWKAGEDG